MKGDNKAEIEAKIQAVIEASAKLMEIAQQKAAAEQAGGAQPQQQGNGAADDDVVDAEFEEVKDDDKK